MKKIALLLTFYVLVSSTVRAQQPVGDSLLRPDVDSMALSIDSSLDYDELFDELSDFLDSLTGPRRYATISLSGSQGYFNYLRRQPLRIESVPRYIWSPSAGYFGKSGLGLNVAAFIINDTTGIKLYQWAVTPSFDYLKDRRLSAGVSFTRYYTQDKLTFYTSPLQNEINGYFTWRKSWLKPGLAAGYGWGSRTSYTSRRIFLDSLKRRATLFSQRDESVADFSLTFSLRHDFFWLDVFSRNDYIRLSPVLTYTLGTQNFGFNRSSGISAATAVYNVQTINLDNNMKFQPLSSILTLRGEYMTGKFFVQPQLMLEYYFPASDHNFSALFAFSTGFMF